VVEAVRQSNNDVGARLLEMSGTEYMIRAKGYVKSSQDLENLVIGTDYAGTPVLVKNVANVVLGPDRRGYRSDGGRHGGGNCHAAGRNALNVSTRWKSRQALAARMAWSPPMTMDLSPGHLYPCANHRR
jgi:Cu(I)/Ag(I) efflux system membrane protein CusA/SilA